MRNKVVQISLFDIYTDVLDAAEENKSEFIRLMEEHIDLAELIPARFYHAFYSCPPGFITPSTHGRAENAFILWKALSKPCCCKGFLALTA